MRKSAQECARLKELVRAKLRNAGVNQAFLDAFVEGPYTELLEGSTGLIPEAHIEAVKQLPAYEDLCPPQDPEALLSKMAVIKLNGGLGTGMGLMKAKSLLEVKDGRCFLDFIAKQHLEVRKRAPARLLFLNSFATSADSLAHLASKFGLGKEEEIELMQNKAPKILADTFEPAEWPEDPEQEWCPPGHGDLYACLDGSGLLDRLLADGYRYAFVSNSDNLGSTVDERILGMLAESNAGMVMEVCQRSPADRKGGHLCVRDGKLILREAAMTPPEDENSFQDIALHRFFNTNNYWLNLEVLRNVFNAGPFRLPMIRNAKTLVPRDASTPKVYQLETAGGSGIGLLPNAKAVVVPRSRFVPVKTCDDLFVLRSDAFRMEDNCPKLVKDARPIVTLDKAWYHIIDDMDTLAPAGLPSLVDCVSLDIVGPVEFAAGVHIRGKVTITNTSEERVVISRDLADEDVRLP